MRHGVYVGDEERLKGKGALLMNYTAETVQAQFDDRQLPEAFGWHTFKVTDFKTDQVLGVER